jgi:ATP phosphoribosyltransferase
MIRLALPKGRNLVAALAAFRAAGFALDGLSENDRRLRLEFPADRLEVLLLKDRDLPLYVEYGIADIGIVGSDVLEEEGGDLLVPARLLAGRCRLSLIGRAGALPKAGAQVRLASKYPRTTRRILADKEWGAEILELSGSVELAPLLNLAEVAIDIVQTGRTLRDNGLCELEVLREVAPCLVVNRAAFHQQRAELNDLIDRFEKAGVAE